MSDGQPSAAKRILSLDGGGVRGVVSIAFLERMEAELRRATGNPDMTLGRHFHLIGGTSVGSIIATMLALDWPMEKVSRTFLSLCPEIFSKRRWAWPLRTKFNEGALNNKIAAILGDMRLDDQALVTMVAYVSKRLDTGSPWWIVASNRSSKFWKGDAPHMRNHDFRLADLIRASTAAPTIFKPQKIDVGPDLPGTFVDGGLSPFNNPSLALLMLASLEGHGINWPLGPDRLTLVSVGTGTWRNPVRYSRVNRVLVPWFGFNSLLGMITDSQMLSLAMLQWMSEPRRPWPIDSEIGTLAGQCLASIPGAAPGLLRFQRYDIALDPASIAPYVSGRRVTAKLLHKLRSLDNPREIQTLYQAAQKAAQEQVEVQDFT